MVPTVRRLDVIPFTSAPLSLHPPTRSALFRPSPGLQTSPRPSSTNSQKYESYTGPPLQKRSITWRSTPSEMSSPQTFGPCPCGSQVNSNVPDVIGHLVFSTAEDIPSKSLYYTHSQIFSHSQFFSSGLFLAPPTNTVMCVYVCVFACICFHVYNHLNTIYIVVFIGKVFGAGLKLGRPKKITFR